MSRYRRSVSRKLIETELFPFLSVLACTIGTLILLIIVASTQIFQPEVTIIAKSEDGKNQTKIPRYIECQEDGIIIHPGQEFVPKEDIGKANSALASLLNEVSNRKNQEYLIVAVRPNGIDVFQQVRELIEQKDIDIGFEPIEQGWQLKLQESSPSN